MKKYVALFLSILLLLSALCSCAQENDDWAKQVAAYRAAKLAQYEEENARYADYEVDVAFLGDSLTDGYDVAAHYPQYTVVNRGIGGDTTFDLEGRLEVSLYELQPKVAVMLIGANNPATMLENYERILQGFCERAPHTRIILLSMTSMSGDWGKNNQLAAYNNVHIKLLAQKYSFAYVDLYSALFNLDTGEIYPEYTTDGGHLTPRGYEILTREITPVIEAQLLSRTTENSPKK